MYMQRFCIVIEIKFYSILYTLLKIIKGTHVRNGIAGLPDMLHFVHDVCLIGLCISYIKVMVE